MAVVIYMFILYMKNIISRLNTSHSETIDTRIGMWGLALCLINFCSSKLIMLVLSAIDGSLLTQGERPEDSGRTLFLYFIPLSMFYFAIVGGESTYYTNIFSYAICHAGMDASKSAVLNSLFWAGFGSGRASGIFLTKYIRPSYYIMIDSVGVLVASVLLVIDGSGSGDEDGSGNENILWVIGLVIFDQVHTQTDLWQTFRTVGNCSTVGDCSTSAVLFEKLCLVYEVLNLVSSQNQK